MQTFLPYPSFKLSAQVLDDRRLGKQRSESMIILKTLLKMYEKAGGKGWPNHPATKMWQGHERLLVQYSIAICDEWTKRGHSDTCRDWFLQVSEDIPVSSYVPAWLGNKEFHQSHRSNLLRKEPEHYRQFWPDERDDLPYVWP